MLKIVHQDGCDNYDFVHASGDCICLICMQPYWKHSYCAQSQNESCYIFGEFFLHVLCDGQHVKL